MKATEESHADFGSPSVTVVVATFGRPDALVCALESIQLQTYSHWNVLIIGDQCGPDTAKALAPFLADERFTYVNLPFRCGEQALPNSAGMAAARSDWVAFLNQDDLWMPWHLDYALQQLHRQGAEFFLGRSAWSWGQPSKDREESVLHAVTPLGRSSEQVFWSGFHLIEPASAWVFRRDLADRVGLWRRSMDLYRPPIQDWYLRAWRANVRLVGGEKVSCFKFENQWLKSAPQIRYQTAAQPQQSWIKRLRARHAWTMIVQELQQLSDNPDAAGRGIVLDAAPTTSTRLQRMAKVLLTPEFAEFYRRTGLDSFSWLCTEVGVPKGARWREALAKRTGEQDLSPPQIEAVVEYVINSMKDQAEIR